MGSFVGVAHAPDDGGEEERDGVEGGVDSDRDKHVHIYFPVLECLTEVFEIELVSERRSVVLQSALHLRSFGVGEEFGAVAMSVSI